MNIQIDETLLIALNDAVSKRDEDIERLLLQLAEWERVGNAIMLCATGKEAPLSDSDVCGVITELRAQLKLTSFSPHKINVEEWLRRMEDES